MDTYTNLTAPLELTVCELVWTTNSEEWVEHRVVAYF